MNQLNTAPQHPQDQDRHEASKVTPIKSDYVTIHQMRNYYEQTGRCNDHKIYEVARLAHYGVLIQPKSAHQFQAQLQDIDGRLVDSINTLVEIFHTSPQDSRKIQNCLATLGHDIDGLVTLARQHQDLDDHNPDVDEIQCFKPLTKLVSDVLYCAQALYDFWQGDHLCEKFAASGQNDALPAVEEYLIDLETAVNCLQDRLLMIVLDQVPGVDLEEYI